MSYKIRVFDAHGNRMCLVATHTANKLIQHGEASRLESGGIQMTTHVSKCLSDEITTCALCGHSGKNTRHHIVPKCIFRHFSALYEQHGHFFINLCLHCHEAYETKASHLKNWMAASTPKTPGIMHEIAATHRKANRASKISSENWDDFKDDLGDKSPEEVMIECKVACKHLHRQLWAEVINQFGGPAAITKQWADHFLSYADETNKTQRINHDLSSLKEQVRLLIDAVTADSNP